MPTKATIRQVRYDKEHTIKYTLKLNKESDEDILKAIDKLVNKDMSKQGAIKYLIRKAIKKES